MFRITSRIHTRLFIFTTALALAACVSGGGNHVTAPTDGTRATLAILESTDIHSNLVGYDYYKLAEDKSIGFDRLATLVREARKQYENTLLFDAGDTIQGTALSDWRALAAPLPCAKELTVYKAMDALGYDGGTIGNHEFNYGLPFLAQVTGHPMNVDGVSKQRCAGPHFPQVLANVVSARDNQPIFPPFAVLDRTIKVRDASGHESSAPIRIGIIGFTPPTVANWDKHNLAGKVIAQGLVESAQKYLPALLAKNVDIVIAISHGGIDTSPYSSEMESANWYLAEVPGIDVLLLGHSHLPFPAPNDQKSRFNNLPEVDNVRGFVHGKPAVMANFWGKS
ncbi:MAG: metallophosphoesterase, partial [Dokdonella sp.]